jgi:hypothetical protein
MNILLKNNISAFVLTFQITDSPVLSNASTPESSSFDDTARTPPSSLRSNENLIIDKTDNQESKIQSTINRRFSRPKIAIEDVQSK